jgi:hypothetical protein
MPLLIKVRRSLRSASGSASTLLANSSIDSGPPASASATPKSANRGDPLRRSRGENKLVHHLCRGSALSVLLRHIRSRHGTPSRSLATETQRSLAWIAEEFPNFLRRT